MKKISLALALLCAALISNAQMDQGKALLSGGFGFSSANMTTETKMGNDLTVDQGAKISGFNFGGFAGFFLADYVALGLNLNYASATMTTIPANDQTMKATTSLMMFAPSLNMYAEMGRDLYFNGSLAIGFGFGSLKSELIDGSTSTIVSDDISAFMFGFSPGFSYMLSEYFSLDMQWGFLGYQSQTEKIDIGDTGDYMHTKTSEFGLNLDLSSIRLGISVQI